METGIFRKTSLEKISSPEQLNDCIKLLQPRLWHILLGFFAILGAAGIWVFTGTIPERVSLRGVVFSENGKLALYAYTPFTVSKRLSQNMPVQVSPDYAVREEFGYIYGKITNIGNNIIDEAYLTQRYGNPSFVQGILPPANHGNLVEIKIDLGDFIWSNPKGMAVTLENGVYCTGIIVIKERRPYEFFIRCRSSVIVRIFLPYSCPPQGK
jgi:hypothetical protein